MRDDLHHRLDGDAPLDGLEETGRTEVEANVGDYCPRFDSRIGKNSG